MASNGRVVINLATGLEDAERVTVAFLVGGAALAQGKQVAMFLTKEAVRFGLPGQAEHGPKTLAIRRSSRTCPRLQSARSRGSQTRGSWDGSR